MYPENGLSRNRILIGDCGGFVGKYALTRSKLFDNFKISEEIFLELKTKIEGPKILLGAYFWIFSSNYTNFLENRQNDPNVY